MLTVPSAETAMLGKNVGDFIEPGAKVLEDGSVVATFKHVTGFEAFNKSNPAEQEGYYFPLRLTQQGQKMTIKRDGIVRPDKQNIAFDPDLLLRIPDRSTYFDIEVDGKKVITLNFAGSTLLT